MAELLKEKRKTWAIWAGEPASEGLGLIGYGWFGNALNISPALARVSGLRIMFFETRRQAQEHLLIVKGGIDHGKFPRAKVVRVVVTIERKR